MRLPKENNQTQYCCVSEDEMLQENRTLFKKWFADTRPELAHEVISYVEGKIHKNVQDEIDWRKHKERWYPEMSEIELEKQITRDIWLTILNEIMDSVFIWVDMEWIQKKIDAYWRGCDEKAE